MALSNIGKEPIREVTEQLVGTIALAALLIPDYWLGVWLQAHDKSVDKPPVILYMIVAVIGLVAAGIILWGVMLGIHAIGEELCNSLAERGVELRPRDRP